MSSDFTEPPVSSDFAEPRRSAPMTRPILYRAKCPTCPVVVYCRTDGGQYAMLLRHLERRHKLIAKDPELEREPPPQLTLPEPDEFGGLFAVSDDPQSGDVKLTMPDAAA